MAICLLPSSSSSSSIASSNNSKAWIIHGIVVGVSVVDAAGAHAYFTRFHKFRSRVVGIIPARFASSRFSGKPLVQILGKPMIQIVGSFWYLLAIECNDSCWQKACSDNGCNKNYLYCENQHTKGYSDWQNKSKDILNQALDNFNTAVVSPIYYALFTAFTILASAIMFKIYIHHCLQEYHGISKETMNPGSNRRRRMCHHLI